MWLDKGNARLARYELAAGAPARARTAPRVVTLPPRTSVLPRYVRIRYTRRSSHFVESAVWRLQVYSSCVKQVSCWVDYFTALGESAAYSGDCAGGWMLVVSDVDAGRWSENLAGEGGELDTLALNVYDEEGNHRKVKVWSMRR
jgi:DMSO/TMAO reductase YedYZ molybdopterin-dependent catalytic subunit